MNVENILFFCSLRWHFYVCEKKIQSEEFQNFNLRSEKNFLIKFYQTLQQHIAIVFLPVLSRQMASMTPTHKLYSHPHAEENVFPFSYHWILCVWQHTCLSKGTRFEWKITFERLLVSLRNDDDDDDKTMLIWYKCEMCVGFYYWTLTSMEGKNL